jgi:cysteinyl-tRNA synthetase
MTVLYQQDIAALGCAAPDVEPKVSEHIGDIITLIEGLIERGAAYVVEEQGRRDVYYAVRAFRATASSASATIEDLRVGARIEANEIKRDPLDFALWKGCDETSGAGRARGARAARAGTSSARR